MSEDNSVRLTSLIAPPFYNIHRHVQNGDYAEYWLKGGRGSTKSSFISVELVLGILKDPQANAIAYRRVANTLKDSVYEQIKWAIEKMGLEEYFRFKTSPMEIIYTPTQQKIMFRGTDDPLKSKSIKVSKGYFKFLWFEELAEFRGMDDVRSVKQSVLRGVGDAYTFYSYNPPKSAQSWVNVECLSNRPDRLIHSSTYLDVPPSWLGQAFLTEAEALKNANEIAYRHAYLGEVTGTGGQVFDNLNIREIKDEEYDALEYFFNGVDFGFAVDPDVFVRWGYDKRNAKIYAVKEYYGSHTPTDTLAQKIHDGIGKKSDIVYCDCAEPRMINELRTRGINSIGVKKGAGSRDHGYRWLQEVKEIVIDPARTPNIAREFSCYEYERDKDGNFLSNYPDLNDHTLDATRYALNVEIARKYAKTTNEFY